MIQRPPGTPPGFPDSTTRSVVSVILFAHLFVVLAALCGGLSPGRDGDQNLKERLREVVAPYSQSLNFDTTARYYLTHATADDVDCRIEYLPKAGDPNTATDWVILESGIPGSEQRQRYQRLAEILAGLGDRQSDDAAAVVVAAIGEHLKSVRGDDIKQVRCFRHMLQERDDVDGTNEARRNPDDTSYFVEVYRAQLVRIGGGRIQARRVGTAGQESPVIRQEQTP